MAINIEMNILQSNNIYESLYPKTLGSLVDGKVSSALVSDSCIGNSATATTLQNARNIRTNLNSSTSASFNGSSDITPGVTGTLPITNGGTEGTSASTAVYNLLNSLSSRSSANVNSYANTTYLGCYYGSSGYKIPISNLLTYFQNNLSGSGAVFQTVSYSGTGTGNTVDSMIINFPSVSGKTLTYGFINPLGIPTNSSDYTSSSGRYSTILGGNVVYFNPSDNDEGRTAFSFGKITFDSLILQKHSNSSVRVRSGYNTNGVTYFVTGIWL